MLYISIHAPREGGDEAYMQRRVVFEISIHAPREGGDVHGKNLVWLECIFQSTPPARGATIVLRHFA